MKIILSNDLTRAVYRTWDEIYPDAGYCTVSDRGELVIDRLPEAVRTELAELLKVHGYRKVRNAIGKTVEI